MKNPKPGVRKKKVIPEADSFLYEIIIDNLNLNLDFRTTLYVKNIPNKYT